MIFNDLLSWMPRTHLRCVRVLFSRFCCSHARLGAPSEGAFLAMMLLMVAGHLRHDRTGNPCRVPETPHTLFSCINLLYCSSLCSLCPHIPLFTPGTHHHHPPRRLPQHTASAVCIRHGTAAAARSSAAFHWAGGIYLQASGLT